MEKESTNEITRREFVRNIGLAAGGVAFGGFGLPSEASNRSTKVSPNEKILLGLIGCGGMGGANMRTLMQHPEVEVVALCDVDENRIPGDFLEVQRKYGKKPSVYRDFRKLLERKDIDAVIIGTPDHWHALNLIYACEAGKDAYCEKPISFNVVEANAMVAAVKKYKRIVQVGTWQRSVQDFTDVISYVRSGKLGKVILCRSWMSDSFRAGRQQPTTPPKELNYDFWTGPAELIPYKPNHLHFNWRWFLNYGGGMTTDWGVHLIDIILLGMSQSNDLIMPKEVKALGGLWAITDDDRTAPDTTEAILKFENPDFIMHWKVSRDHPGVPYHGIEFVSADGRTLRLWRGGWMIFDPDGKELPKETFPPTNDHWRNWLDCIKSREKPRADLESLAQTTIVCHLINASLLSGETVHWDKRKMDIVGNAGKDTLAYHREYRKPWKLPMHKV